MAQLTLRIYKDEIDGNRMNFIRSTFTVFDESDKVLLVEGSEEDIVKLYDNCLLSDERFKQAFPEYRTYTERIEHTNAVLESVSDHIRTALCDIIATGAKTKEFKILREFYLEHLK